MEDSAERWAGENILTHKVKTLVETCIIKASNPYQNNVRGVSNGMSLGLTAAASESSPNSCLCWWSKAFYQKKRGKQVVTVQGDRYDVL